jgi:hypothetical protein
MNIINKPVILTINGATVDFTASGTKLETNEIKLTTLTHATAGQDHLDGCTWLLSIAEVNASIVAQVEALLL